MLSQSSKRSSSISDDTLIKSKKKKVDKAESAILNPAQKVLKEICILRPAWVRRKTTESFTSVSSAYSPTSIPKAVTTLSGTASSNTIFFSKQNERINALFAMNGRGNENIKEQVTP